MRMRPSGTTQTASGAKAVETNRRQEVVRLYSNLVTGAENVLQLRGKATSTRRPPERTRWRQAQVRVEPHEADALAKAYTEGKAIKELARTYGAHRLTVTSTLRRLGVELRQKGLTAEQVIEASRLYPDGWSLARLAQRYGVHDMTVRRYLLLAGVVMRAPHQRRK
jgi:lambda repressor-like predicted transcriptional regulator